MNGSRKTIHFLLFFSSTPDDFYAIKVRQKHHTVDFPIPSLNVSSLQIMLKKAPFPLSLGYTSQTNQPESDLINCSHYGREFLFYFFKAQVSKTRTGGLNCTRCNSYVAHWSVYHRCLVKPSCLFNFGWKSVPKSQLPSAQSPLLEC